MSAVEKATVLASVAASPLAKRRVLRDLGVPKSTYYRWLMRQQHQQGLEDRPGASAPPWNRLRPQEERSILEAAREMPELSSRQLAAWSTDNLAFAVSESTVYRILCREGLVNSPEMQLKAGKEYHRKTSGPHQMWATDASYFKVIGWGYYYLVTVMDDYSRFILAHKLQRDMTTDSLIEVVEDSRCPEDVTCIQAGRALILVEVSGEAFGGTQHLTLEEAGRPDLDRPSVVDADLHYLFELLRLDPYPNTTVTASHVEYTAILHVTTLPIGSGQDSNGSTGSPDDAELSLQAELVDDSPLTIRLVAEIVGGPDNNRELYCQGWEWDLGDGMVAAVMPGCVPWTAYTKINRRFTENYTYETPGTYEITFSTGPLDPATVVVEVR